MPALAEFRPVIMVHTRDRARALPFWRDVLGLRLVAEDAFSAVFDAGGTLLRLTDVPDWVAHPHTILGLDVPDIDTAVTRLAGAGVACLHYDGFGQDARGIWTAPDGRVKVAWFADPDGNNLSVSQGAVAQG
jgi:catechol 2,3-dioxygenase-like lactoylglutathione lyase family enzyme